jgi:lipopolysaccharide transport system ATP-binding protein
MSDIAIKVENLGKSYLVGHNTAQTQHYTALRDVIAHNAKNLARKTRDMFAGRPIVQGDEVEEFWALKDVSFDVQRGETLSIIGRNGAGKSTLLKILSRITDPTTGRITINGRVASLLEVGTGFHPELSGRENIYLNGAILGMSRVEIQRKFDEIVAFAEVDNFLDTPVKRYSSGMYVRLAFAVAAHLEPEILVVDEVLAVGDAQFQTKCLGKMGDVAKEGRTVIFVTHNMSAALNLCRKGLLLVDGQLVKAGETEYVIQSYLSKMSANIYSNISERCDRHGSGLARLSAIKISDEDDGPSEYVTCGHNVKIYLKFFSEYRDLLPSNLSVSIGIDNSLGQRVLHLSTETLGYTVSNFDVDHDELVFNLDRLALAPDTYSLVCFLSHRGDIIDWIQNAAKFDVVAGDFYGTGKIPPKGQGAFFCNYSIAVSQNNVLL